MSCLNTLPTPRNDAISGLFLSSSFHIKLTNQWTMANTALDVSEREMACFKMELPGRKSRRSFEDRCFTFSLLMVICESPWETDSL